MGRTRIIQAIKPQRGETMTEEKPTPKDTKTYIQQAKQQAKTQGKTTNTMNNQDQTQTTDKTLHSLTTGALSVLSYPPSCSSH
jgi:hypothetical protein